MADRAPTRSFLDRLLGRTAFINGNGHAAPPTLGTKAGGVTLGPGVLPGLDFFSPDGARTIHYVLAGANSEAERVSTQTAYAASVYAFAAMRWRAARWAEPPLMIVKEDQKTGDPKWLPRHPLAPLLEDPSPDYDMPELLFRTSLYVDRTGHALWTKDDDNAGLPGRLTPFSGDEFSIRGTRDRIRGEFIVHTARGEKIFTPDEVIYFHEPDPSNWLRGLPRLEVFLGWLNLSQVARATVRDLLANAVWPSLVLQPDAEWNPTPEELAEYKTRAEAYANPGRRGKPLTMLGGGSATVVSARIRDLIPEDILNRVEANTASAFGVPAIVLQFMVGMENAPWSQMEQARRMGYEDTAEPMWKDVASRLTRQLLRPIDPDTSHFVRYDTSKIRALQADKLQLSTIASMWGRMASLNERRTLVGLEPLDDPAADDVPELTQPNPLGLVPGADPNAPAADPAAKAVAQSKADVLRLFDLDTKSFEPRWEGAVLGLLVGLRLKTVAAARRHLREVKAASPIRPESVRAFQLAFDALLDQTKPQLKTRTYPLVLETGSAAVKRLSSRIGLSFSVLEPGLLQYAATRSSFLAEVMTTTTGKAVGEAVQAGLDAGETVAGLVRRLEELPAFDRTRAKLVARTETTAAWNGAQRRAISAYQETSGRMARKTWLSARDDLVRPEHQLLDGEEIGVNDTFSNGLTEPGEPNCRCTLIYSFMTPTGREAEVDEPAPE